MPDPRDAPTALVIEDDEAVRELVRVHLEHAGFRVRDAADGRGARGLLAGSDVVVLDRMLPDGDGLDLLASWRAWEVDAAVPVLVLTARASEADRVGGLDAGADDYLVKPFSAAELVARLRALLRRSGASPLQRVGAITVDRARARVWRDDREVALTPREFDLLAFLVAHPGRVFRREQLLDRVWGEDFFGTARTVDQHVAQLRERLGSDVIDTVRGRGYRMRERVGPG